MVFAGAEPDLPFVGLTDLLLGPLLLFQSFVAAGALNEEEPDAGFALDALAGFSDLSPLSARSPLSPLGDVALGAFPFDGPAGLALNAFAGVTLTSSGAAAAAAFVFLTTLFAAACSTELDFAIILWISVSSSGVNSLHSPIGRPLRLIFIIRIRSRLVTSRPKC